MARKNILAGLMDDSKEFTAVNPDPEEIVERQQVTFKGKGALGAVTRSIDALAARADSARAMEEKLAAGQMVVELDPSLLEDSFVSDRLQQADDAFFDLVAAIRAHGQDSPIMVRPHPLRDGRYQIVFGHRRARAARELGLPVRAIVKKLDDRDHVIAQGQENSARADLSFIERTMFAFRLDERGFDRETIMQAMSVDKTTLSKMMSVGKRLPSEILDTLIGARSVGRDRWHDLSARMEDGTFAQRASKLVLQQDYLAADPDRRFEMLEKFASKRSQASRSTGKSETRAWQRQGGAVKAKIKSDGKQFTLALRAEKAAAFGAYIEENLDSLYEAFEQSMNQ